MCSLSELDDQSCYDIIESRLKYYKKIINRDVLDKMAQV